MKNFSINYLQQLPINFILVDDIFTAVTLSNTIGYQIVFIFISQIFRIQKFWD